MNVRATRDGDALSIVESDPFSWYAGSKGLGEQDQGYEPWMWKWHSPSYKVRSLRDVIATGNKLIFAFFFPFYLFFLLFRQSSLQTALLMSSFFLYYLIFTRIYILSSLQRYLFFSYWVQFRSPFPLLLTVANNQVRPDSIGASKGFTPTSPGQ